MAKNNQIQFRRIRGRIVPIKSGALSKKEKSGLKLAGASAVVGLGAGLAAGVAVDKGNKIQRLSRFTGNRAAWQRKALSYNQLLLGESGGKFNKRFKQTFKLSQKATQQSQLARKLRVGGMGFAIASGFATAALFQAGITPILDRRVKGDATEKNIKKGFITNAATTGIAAGITLLGARSVGARKAARLFNKYRK